MSFFRSKVRRLLVLLVLGLLVFPGCKREPATNQGPEGQSAPGVAGQEQGGPGALAGQPGQPGGTAQPGMPGNPDQAGQGVPPAGDPGQGGMLPGGPGGQPGMGQQPSPLITEADIDAIKGAMKASLAAEELKKAPALDVTLESIAALNKYRTIEVMVQKAGMTVTDAAALADKVPGLLVAGVPQEEAEKLVDAFGALGATLSFKAGPPKANEVKAEVKVEAAAAAPAPAAGAVYEGPSGLSATPTGIADCLVKGPEKARVVVVELTDYQ